MLYCDILITALRDDDGEVSPNADHALGEAGASVSSIPFRVVCLTLALSSCRILEAIKSRIEEWAKLDTMTSLLRQDDIREGVDELQNRVDTCVTACNVLLLRDDLITTLMIPYLLHRLVSTDSWYTLNESILSRHNVNCWRIERRCKTCW